VLLVSDLTPTPHATVITSIPPVVLFTWCSVHFGVRYRPTGGEHTRRAVVIVFALVARVLELDRRASPIALAVQIGGQRAEIEARRDPRFYPPRSRRHGG